jgi:hypothetical protein
MVTRQDNAAAVRALALRVTRLTADGTPAVGTTSDIYMTPGFIKLGFSANYSEGAEIEVTNGAGQVCVYYKMPDTIKDISINLELCDPDPVLTQMLTGGVVLAGNVGEEGVYAPAGVKAGDQVALGYAAERSGEEANPYGVAIEVWASAVLNGKSANQMPFWHYLIPYARLRHSGDRVIESGALATVFAGNGGGNAAFGSGPSMDLEGVTPAPPAGAFDWPFPQVTERPFAYTRADNAPLGLRGVFDNEGTPPIAVVRGIPATLIPANATRPANLTALIALGALGNTTAWSVGQFLGLADGSRAYWNGTAWVAGATPAPVVTATGATAGTPGAFTPNGATPPATLAALQSGGVTASPTTAWTTGQRVVLGNGTLAYWTGSAWAAGAAA